MFVKVEFIVQTPDFGRSEFMKEIKVLIQDIDPEHTKLEAFDMYEVSDNSLATAEKL